MRGYRRSGIAAVILVFTVGLMPAAGADDRGGKRTDDGALFSAPEYLSHVTYLASDELEGRGTGQEGNAKAGDYIASVFEQDGLKPAGNDGTYFQNFKLETEHRIGDATSLVIGAPGAPKDSTLNLHIDFMPFPFSKAGAFAGDVVFAGFGIVNEGVGYNDYDGLDVTDKVVLVLRGAPRFAEFDMDKDASLRAKTSNAIARRAAAVLVVNSLSHPGGPTDSTAPSDQPEDKLYEFKEPYPGAYIFGREDYGIPMLHVTRAAAEKMLEAAAMPDLAALEHQIEEGHGPNSKPLGGVSTRGVVAIEPVETPARNVVGLIPGTGANADEFIVLGAHYDHVGVIKKGEPDFDPKKDIFNGADDNASGTAMLLGMAGAFTRGPAPNRSILLIAFSAEEMGLLGSRYFVDHPTVDLARCIVMLNFDMVGRLKNDRLEIGGMRTGGFEDMVQRLAGTYGLNLRDGGGGLGPSDHDGFCSKSIPVMFFFTGLHRQYHKPTDDSNLINPEGAMRIARLAADCIDEIDANPQRPVFTADPRGFTLDVQDNDRGECLGRVAWNRSGAQVRLSLMRTQEGGDLADDEHVIKIGGSPIGIGRDLMTAVRKMKSGETVRMVVERNGLGLEMEVGTSRRGRADQPFGECGESLIALARRLRGASGTSTAGRVVSWMTSGDSLSFMLRSTDRDEAMEFVKQAAEILKQLPEPDRTAVTIAIKTDTDPSKEPVTEIAIKLKKQGSSSGGAARTKNDSGDKGKAHAKRRHGRRSWSGRRKSAA
ncbi:MAG TPA: M28 family peptidase [Phycisphaerae bacterium]|nr:M28 family peptidase [Phycisphaerae bacterium]